MSTYTIREMHKDDDLSALNAWNEVFARGGGASPRTASDWGWAYEANPAGRRACVALRENRVVALYAARPVRVIVDGAEHTFGQIVDSLVLPDHRAGLRRPGLFVEVGRDFFDSFGARGRDLAYFGWPVEAAWRAGERFLSYGMLRPEIVLAREVGAGGSDTSSTRDRVERDVGPRGFGSRDIGSPAPRVEASAVSGVERAASGVERAGSGVERAGSGVERIERFGDDARALYERCRGGFGASAIRDARWLEWRLAPRPGVEYRRFGVRDGEGHLRGYAIQRSCAFLMESSSVVVDWLVPPDDLEAAEMLLGALLHQSRADGCLVLCGLVPPWSPWFAWFQRQGFRAHPSHHVMSARSFHAQFDLDWLRENFWYQWIDSDLV